MPSGSTWLVLVSVIVGVIGGALSGIPPACACSCVPTTAAEAQAEADLVFIGTVTRQVGAADPDSPEPVTFRFSVEAVVKGAPITEPSYDVQTGNGTAACGISFEVGARYAVYAVNSDGVLFATGCGGTHPLADDDPGPTPAQGAPASHLVSRPATVAPSARSGVPPRPVTAVLVPAAQTEPAFQPEAIEEDQQMPVEGVVAAVGIIGVLLVAILLVSRRRD